MEFQKIANFLDTTSDDKDLPRFVTEKWIDVYDQLEGNYSINKEIRIKTSMLRSDLCDFNAEYIVVKGGITLEGDNDPLGATFIITDTKLYVRIVTLSKENEIKLLEQLKTGFKRTIK